MSKRGFVTLAVVVFFFILFFVFLFLRSTSLDSIVGFTTYDVDSDGEIIGPMTFNVNQDINGIVSLEIVGDNYVYDGSKFSLVVLDGENIISAKNKTAGYVFGDLFDLDAVSCSGSASAECFNEVGEYELELSVFNLNVEEEGDYMLALYFYAINYSNSSQVIRSTIAEEAIEVVNGSILPLTNLSVDDILFTKILISGNGSIESVDGDFIVRDTIACVIDYDMDEDNSVNLSLGFYHEDNSTTTPNKVYLNVLDDSSIKTECDEEENACLAYYNVTHYAPGDWSCFAKWDGREEISDTLEMVNSAPIFLQDIAQINISLNGSYSPTLDLDVYFDDLENQNLTYGAVGQRNINITIFSNGMVSFANSQNFDDMEIIRFRAHDGLLGTFSNNVTIKVGTGAVPESCNPVWDCEWDFCVEGQQTCVYFDANNCDVLTGKPADIVRICQASANVQTQASQQITNLDSNLEIEIPKFGKTTRTLLTAGIAIVLLALVGGGIYLLLISKKSKIELKPQQNLVQTAKPVVKSEPKRQLAQQVLIPELSKYVSGASEQGQTLSKIKSDLLKVGWKEKDINYTFDYFKIKKFVVEKLKVGLNKESIISTLKIKGWKDDIINAVLEELGK